MRRLRTKCSVGIGVLIALGGPGLPGGPVLLGGPTCLSSRVCNAGTVPPLDFVTIGDAGNRDTIPSEMGFRPDLSFGAVDYEFQITRSPVTVEQYFEFVDVYKNFTESRSQDFIGSGSFFTPEDVIFSIRPQQSPIEVSWRYAARYMNWLHNDKAVTAEAFESGVYDTSTFGRDADNNFTDQREPAPGSQFWLPRYDEWIKAVYYDPNRYGEGLEGYWEYPDGGTEPLIGGLPENGGETDASNVPILDPPLDVGSYPHVQSPYGLLDVSGGVLEFLTDDSGFIGLALRISSNRQFSEFPPPRDRIYDVAVAELPFLALNGFRVVTVVPAPSALLGATVGWMLFVAPRRRTR